MTDQLIYNPAYKTRVVLSKSSYQNLNQWSKTPKKIEVCDYYLNPRDVKWKGQTIHVADYELFLMLVKDWMVRYGWTKEQALDEMFAMSVV